MRFPSLTIAALCLSTSAASASPMSPFTGFVGIGDSFSDKGRFGQLQPPSNGGRFTTGQTWMEVLGAEFEARGQGNFNMSVGGAVAGDVNTNDPDYALFDFLNPPDPTDPDDIATFELGTFSRQVASFAAAGFDALVGNNPLVTVFIGSNDFLQDPLVNPLAVIGQITEGISEMVALGPQFDSFMVGNLFDFSIQPGFFNAPDPVKLDIRNQSLAFNFLLDQALQGLALTEGIEIEIFDFFGVTDLAFAEAQTAGLVLDEPCTDRLLDLVFDPNNCVLTSDPTSFLFVDAVHPGDFIHTRWGAAAVAQVEARLEPIPLPAGLPLLVAGLAGLMLLRQRQRAKG